MRITLIYLLTCCILFFNGMKSGIPEMNRSSKSSGIVKFLSDKEAGFCGLNDTADNDTASVLADDDDDNESSTVKKRKAEHRTLLFNNIFLNNRLTGPVAANRFYKHFSYLSSHRYILHCVLIV